MNVYDCANELAKAMRESQEYKKLKEAKAALEQDPKGKEMAEEFFRAVAMESGLTLHINVLYGSNVHHMIEGMFKAFARALAQAVALDSRVHGVMSSKGTL